MFAGGDGAGKLHRAAVEQELFGQCRFARIGMRDDGECPPPGYFVFNVHRAGECSTALRGNKEELTLTPAFELTLKRDWRKLGA